MKSNCFRLISVISLFLSASTMMAQEKVKVTGAVTDGQTNEPLIGVTVRVKGTNNAAVTDLEGKYSISTDKNSVLEFSYIGYLPVEKKSGSSRLDIKLSPDQKSLDEVIVVGYGIQKKSDLTGSVSTVKSEDIQSRAITNVNEAFAGKTSGVQAYSSSGKPGSSPSIQVRGIGSNGSSTPLFVIDGRVSSSAGALDPNDIESIEVLKDGASAAIYGASAGNGVILITTKKGKGNGKISYDLQLASQSLAKKPHVMNSDQFIDYFNEAGVINLENIYNNWDFKQNTDWADVAFGNSLFMKHSLNYQGGNDRGQFYLSGSYLNNNGMIRGDKDTERTYSGMINASYNIKPWLEVGTNNVISYSTVNTISDNTQTDNIITSAVQCSPLTAPTYTLDNMPQMMRNLLNLDPKIFGTFLKDENGNYYGTSPYINGNRNNPLIIRDRSTYEVRNLNVNGTTFMNLKPFKGFVFTTRLSYSFNSMEYYTNTKPYLAEYTTRSYQPYISVNAGTSHSNYWQWENFATYIHKFGQHNLTAMLGTSYSETRTFGVAGSESGNANGNLGFLRNDPNFMYFAYATADATKSITGGEPNYIRKLAYFGRLNYNYRDTYLAQFSLRADAADTSVLPESNRWGYFPSASLGWVISNEKFMSSTHSWLDQLKLRGSWGQNGSLASLGNWMYKSVVARSGRYNFTNELNYSYGYSPTAMGNPNLKWETSEQMDLGFDLRMLNGRFNIIADYYNKHTKDLIITGAKLSNITGFPSSPINAGSITNRGVEVEMGWQDHIGGFSYGIRGNLTTLRNRVTKVYDTVDAIDGATLNYTQVLTRFQKGKPAWYFYGYKYLGVNHDNGDAVYQDLNKDGVINNLDMTYIGKGIPDLTYGITLNAAWKGIDLIVFGSGVSGVDIYNVYDVSSTSYVNNKLTYFTEDRWSPTNPNGHNPRANIDHLMFMQSSGVVFNGAYFKIKQIQVGYTLPKSWIKKISLDNFRVYCSLENFFTFSDYPGFDPEVTGTGNGMGVDYGNFPNSRKVVFGMNVTF